MAKKPAPHQVVYDEAEALLASVRVHLTAPQISNLLQRRLNEVRPVLKALCRDGWAYTFGSQFSAVTCRDESLYRSF